MPELNIRITARPPGGAPDHIRDQWIGVVMPATVDTSRLADVITHRRVADRVGGYAVLWADAMEALGREHPTARRWWEENVHHFSVLIFAPECCEVVPDRVRSKWDDGLDFIIQPIFCLHSISTTLPPKKGAQEFYFPCALAFVEIIWRGL